MSEHKVNPFAKASGLDLPAQVRDLYGRVLQTGDQILLNTPQIPQLYRVMSIAPNIDPKYPANQMVIVLRSDQRFLATRDQRNPEFVLVIEQQSVSTTIAPEPPPSSVGRES